MFYGRLRLVEGIINYGEQSMSEFVVFLARGICEDLGRIRTKLNGMLHVTEILLCWNVNGCLRH